MADPFASPEDPTLRYGQIEQAYRQERWSDVLADGAALLRDLGGRQDPAGPGLIPRLQILLGHTHLYGLGDPRAAADHYAGVLESCREEALCQTAEEGLRLCAAPADPVPAEPAPDQGQPQAAMPWSAAPAAAVTVAAGPADAMPWLGEGPAAPESAASQPQPAAIQPEAAIRPPEEEPAGQPIEAGAVSDTVAAAVPGVDVDTGAAASLIPDVVEEPELIEVHQNDPQLAEEIEAREIARREDGRSRGDRTAGSLAALAQSASAELEELGADPTFSAEEEDRDLLRGLLRVTISAGGGS